MDYSDIEKSTLQNIRQYYACKETVKITACNNVISNTTIILKS